MDHVEVECWVVFGIETFANDLQKILSLVHHVHDCCEQNSKCWQAVLIRNAALLVTSVLC